MKQHDPHIALSLIGPKGIEERISPKKMMIPKAIDERESRIFVPVLTMDKIGNESYFMTEPTFSSQPKIFNELNRSYRLTSFQFALPTLEIK